MIRANGNGNENKGEVMDDKDNSKPTKKRAIANELESLLNRTSNLRHLSALTNHKSKEEPTPLSDYNESTKYSTRSSEPISSELSMTTKSATSKTPFNEPKEQTLDVDSVKSFNKNHNNSNDNRKNNLRQKLEDKSNRVLVNLKKDKANKHTKEKDERSASLFVTAYSTLNQETSEENALSFPNQLKEEKPKRKKSFLDKLSRKASHLETNSDFSSPSHQNLVPIKLEAEDFNKERKENNKENLQSSSNLEKDSESENKMSSTAVQIRVIEDLNLNDSIKNSVETLPSNSISNPSKDASKNKDEDQLDLKKKQKLHEYYTMEEKHANLIKILAGVYNKIVEENAKNQKLAELEDINKSLYPIVESEKLAKLVHEQVALEVKRRVEVEWNEKPYFGDILNTYYHFYKIYKAILERYPTCQISLSNLLNKKAFDMQLKKLLAIEADRLDNVNRIDILLDRIVDFPRRIVQLLESYLKLLNPESNEHSDIKKVLKAFMEISESSNEALNKMNNFKDCYDVLYMFDPPLLRLLDQNRTLIKHGQVNKVAKRNGEVLVRHLILFSDLLLVCKPDRIRRKVLLVNYQIPNKKLKVIECSNESNELMFRLITSDQNNEFKTEKMKEKEDWMKAFRKAKDIEIVEKADKKHSKVDEILEIGINPPIWIKDNEQETCSACREQFTTLRRRHHCRTCGRIYCNNCCNSYVPVKFNDFKDKVRVCRNCFFLLEPVYQDHLNQVSISQGQNGDSYIASTSSTSTKENNLSLINNVNNIIRNKSGNNLNQIKKSRSNSSSSIDELTRSSYELKLNTLSISKDCEKEENTSSGLSEAEIALLGSIFNKSSNQDLTSNESTSSEDESNKSSKRHEDVKIKPFKSSSVIEEKINELRKSSLSKENLTSPTHINPQSSFALRRSIGASIKKEMIDADFGYLKKKPLRAKETIENTTESSPNKESQWERTYFVLYNDLSISVCASKNTINSPNLIIQLGLFKLDSVDDTTIALNIPTDMSRPMNEQDSTLKEEEEESNQDESIVNKPIFRVKNKLKMFESNYELKFANKNLKDKWFSMIQNDKLNK